MNKNNSPISKFVNYRPCQSSEKCTYSFWYSGEMIYPVAGSKILKFMSCIKGKSLKNKFTPYRNFCISQSGPSFLLTYIYKTCRAVYYVRYWFPNIPYRTYLFCQNAFPLNGTNFSRKVKHALELAEEEAI